MKKIAFLGHGTGHGGAGASLILMVKALGVLNYKKFLFVNRISRWEGIESFFNLFEKVELVRIPSIYNDLAGGNTPIDLFNNIVADSYDDFVNKLIENGIDILHINSSVFPHIHRLVKTKTQIKIVTHVREMIPKYGEGEVQQFMISQIKLYSDAIICISDNETLPFIEHPNLFVVPNPFDFSGIESIDATLRKNFEIDENVVLVGMLGQFHKMKGQELFLSILRKIIYEKKEVNKFKFIIIGAQFNPLYKRIIKKIVGKPDYGSEIIDFIKKHKLQEYVIIIPYVKNVFDYLKDLDIVIRPSLSSDPWGRDIIESMAFSKPVIATGDSEFYVQNNKSGYLVDKDNLEIIAEKVTELINNKPLRLSFGKRGKEIIYAKCNSSDYMEKIIKVYECIDK